MKILIAYYSRGGSTEKVAKAIQKKLERHGHSIDIEKIKPIKEHSFIGWLFIRIFYFFKSECEIYSPKIIDVSEYDAVCIGSPNWARLSFPVAKYLQEIKGLKYKKVGFFATTALWPTIEWYVFSAYLLYVTFSQTVEKKDGRIVGDILLSSLFKARSVESDYGRKVVENLCDRIESTSKSFKDYFLNKKEIQNVRFLVVLFSALLFFSLIFQIISSIFSVQILDWSQYLYLFTVGFFALFSMLLLLERKNAVFLGKYLAGAFLTIEVTLIILFLPTDLGRTIISGYILLFIFISLFRNLKAVLFTGLMVCLGYIFLFFNYSQKEIFSPVLDIGILFLSLGIVTVATRSLQNNLVGLLRAQDEIELARSSLEESKTVLEIKVKARTRELEELSKSLEVKVKERTKKLEGSKKALIDMLQDLKEAKINAEEEKEKTLAIISNFSDGLLIFDNKDRLLIANTEAEKFLNLDKKEIVGKSVSELFEFPDMKFFFNAVGKDIKEVFRKELTIKEDLIIEVSTAFIIRDNKRIGKLVLFHNITREKTVQKLKTEFVSIAAHQLRTPLSAIKWTLTTILDGDLGEINKEQKEYLQKTNLSNERMINLIDDLLNLSRIEEGKCIQKNDLFKLEEVIRDVIDSLDIKADKKNIKLNFEEPANFPKVLADKEKIRLVVQNLIENAINYSFNDKEVIISLLKNDDQNEIEFKIENVGIGIPKSQQKRIFTKFFRAENAVKAETIGSGLGLFINKNIIESHEGRIWFESGKDKKIAFYFTIPIKNLNK